MVHIQISQILHIFHNAIGGSRELLSTPKCGFSHYKCTGGGGESHIFATELRHVTVWAESKKPKVWLQMRLLKMEPFLLVCSFNTSSLSLAAFYLYNKLLKYLPHEFYPDLLSWVEWVMLNIKYPQVTKRLHSLDGSNNLNFLNTDFPWFFPTPSKAKNPVSYTLYPIP